MKEFGVSDHDYEHRISVPLRTIMCIDLPRIDYDSNKGKVKKADLDFVKEQNRLSAEKKRIKKEQDERTEAI